MGYFRRDIASPHAMLEIAHRRVEGAAQVHLFGFNRNIQNSYETVWNNGGGIYTFPTEPLTLSVSSSSSQDTMPVLIQGLDESYQTIDDIVTLDGTTAVNSSKKFYRVNSVVILAGSNDGDISFAHDGTTYAYIEAGLGSGQAMVYTTPADKCLYISTAHFTSGTVNGNRYLFSRACQISSNGRTVRFWESTFSTNIVFDLAAPFRIPSRTDFTIEAKSSGNSNELSVYLGGVLLEEDL